MALLERLRSGSASPRGVQQVARHLTDLLGSERGFASVVGDFGVTSETKWGAPAGEGAPVDPIERLRLELVRNIERYEGALGEFTLTARSRDPAGRVAFTLKGRFLGSREEVRLVLVFDIWTRRFEVREERS